MIKQLPHPENVRVNRGGKKVTGCHHNCLCSLEFDTKLKLLRELLLACRARRITHFFMSKHKQLKVFYSHRENDGSKLHSLKISMHEEKALLLKWKRLSPVKKQFPLTCSFDVIAHYQLSSNLRVNRPQFNLICRDPQSIKKI